MRKNRMFYNHIKTIVIVELIALSLIPLFYYLHIPYLIHLLAGVHAVQAIMVYLIVKNMAAQLQQVDEVTDVLVKGNIIESKITFTGAAGKVITKLQKVSAKIGEATEVIGRIGSKQQVALLETEFVHLDAKDSLGQALLSMRDKMQTYQNEEKKRNWSAEGQANFAGILRENTDDLDKFAYQIVRFLVKYLNCNQGSFFIQQEDTENENYLELIACYAYDKKKYQEKRIKIGQGLVGQCAFEKQIMSVTDLPQDYVNITSGLGEATPTHLVIVPLLVNGEFHGAVELASFQKLEAYQLDFLEKASESIASTLNTVKVTLQTQQLLDKSHELTAELRSKEQETREHIGVLIDAQQGMQTKQRELDWIFKAIDNILITATFEQSGKLITANDKLAEFSGSALTEMMEQGSELLISEKEGTAFWKDIQQGAVKSGDFKLVNRKGEEKWINASFTPMQVVEGQQAKVLMLGTDITEKKLVLEKLSLVANNTDNSVIITDDQGFIEFVNDGFVKLTGYNKEEVIGQKPGHLLQGPRTDQETVKRIGQKIKQKMPFYEEILNYRKDGKTYWISLMINPVKNEEGRITKYISIQTDITQIKEDTLDYTHKLEAISRSNAVIEFDMEGNILEVNSIFMSVSGYEHGELEGKPYDYLLPESEKGKPQVQMMWDNLREGTFFSGEFIQKSKQGKDLWLSGTFNPIFDLENKLQKILMFAQFTTHEKEKQNELSSILNALNSSVMTLEMDGEGALKKGNALFLQSFGFKRSEVARKHISDIVKNPEIIPEVLKQLKSESAVKHKLSFITKTEEAKAYQATFNVIQNLENQIHRVMVVLSEC